MSKTISTLQTPFQNLKFITMLYKIMGIFPCKLIKGRFKLSTCGRYTCALWILIHCAYSSVFYYDMYMQSLKEGSQSKILFCFILRFTAFTASLIPYSWVAIFQDQAFVKFSDKLETYDDKARVLGHERKDKNKFIWLFFVITACNMIKYTYYCINKNVANGATEIVKIIIKDVLPLFVATYCIHITCVFLDLIRQRSRHLNEMIIPLVSHLPITGSTNEITVYDVRYLHGMLIDSASLINKLYGIPNILTTFSLLISTVIRIYDLATDGISDNELINALDLFFQIIYLFSMYQFVTYEVNRVEYRILKYGLPFQNNKCRQDAIEMMLYFYHNRYTFTAAEFFILDLSLVFSIIYAALSFVLILVKI